MPLIYFSVGIISMLTLAAAIFCQLQGRTYTGYTVEIRFCRWTSFSVFIPGGKYGGTLYLLYGDVTCTLIFTELIFFFLYIYYSEFITWIHMPWPKFKKNVLDKKIFWTS